MIRTLLQMRNAVPLEAKQQTLDILPGPVATRGDLGHERTLMKERTSHDFLSLIVRSDSEPTLPW